MFCSKCGARLEDDAAFCTECGASRVMRDPAAAQPLAPGQAPSPTLDQTQPVSRAATPTTRMPAVIPPAPVDPASRRRDPRPTQRETRESKERLVVAAGLVGVLIIGGVAGYFLGVHLPAQKAPAAQTTQADPGTAASAPSVDRSDHAVKISVKGEGWNTDAGASKLPVHVEGADADGNAVSTTAYVDSHGVGIILKQGTYELSVLASPLGAKGEVWSPKSSKATIALGGSLREGEEVDVSETVVINLGGPLPAAEETDDAVERAVRYAQDGGCDSVSAAQELVRVATASRDDAKRQKRTPSSRAEHTRRTTPTPVTTSASACPTSGAPIGASSTTSPRTRAIPVSISAATASIRAGGPCSPSYATPSTTAGTPRRSSRIRSPTATRSAF